MNINKKTKKIATYGIFLSLIIILSIVEATLTPSNPANIRMGLSNVVIMYSLFYMGRKDALFLAMLKALFALLARGVTAGLMSFSGGLCSIIVMIIFDAVFKDKISFLLLSISGAVFHNIGQIIMAGFILNSHYIYYYLPVMIGTGCGCGILTGVLLKVTMPYLNRIEKGKP